MSPSYLFFCFATDLEEQLIRKDSKTEVLLDSVKTILNR